MPLVAEGGGAGIPFRAARQKNHSSSKLTQREGQQHRDDAVQRKPYGPHHLPQIGGWGFGQWTRAGPNQSQVRVRQFKPSRQPPRQRQQAALKSLQSVAVETPGSSQPMLLRRKQAAKLRGAQRSTILLATP